MHANYGILIIKNKIFFIFYLLCLEILNFYVTIYVINFCNKGVECEMNSTFKKIFRIIRNISAVLFIFIGLIDMLTSGFLSGLFMMLLGMTLLPVVYKKIKWVKFKYAQFILPLICFILFAVFLPPSNSNNDAVETTTSVVTEENKKAKISSLNLNESEIKLDLKETQDIILEILPENYEIEELDYCTSDDQIAILETTDISEIKNKITLRVKPFSEGNCELFVKSPSGIESNKLCVKVVDSDKAQAEVQSKSNISTTAEQEPKEQAKVQQKSAQSHQTQNYSHSNSKTVQKSNENNSHGRAIYRTPNGKRYHYDPDCGGKNSYKVTLSEALSFGLTPCKKCAQ